MLVVGGCRSFVYFHILSAMSLVISMPSPAVGAKILSLYGVRGLFRGIIPIFSDFNVKELFSVFLIYALSTMNAPVRLECNCLVIYITSNFPRVIQV